MKTILSLLSLFIITGILLLLFSCSKKEDPFDQCPDIDSSVKVSSCFDGYFFDNNSYWTYLNTTTLNVDCTYVKSWSYEFPTVCEPEKYIFKIESSDREINEINYSGKKWEEKFDNPTRIWYDVDFCSKTTIDSLVVNGNTYYNVVMNVFPSRIIYFKPNIGQIRIIGLPNVHFSQSPDTVIHDLINYQVSFFPRR